MMKKILIFEYITGGGLIERKLITAYFEAEIILNSLIETHNYEVNFFVITGIDLGIKRALL